MQVKQITNLFALMNRFVIERRPLTVKEIVELEGWPRSSAFNIVSTLVDCGYLYQPKARAGYYPSSKWMELARELSSVQPFPASVHQLLEQLKSLTGETVFLGAAEGTSVVFLDVAESSADIRYIANVGQRLPIHITAAGCAILSQYESAERQSVLNRVRFDASGLDSGLSSAHAIELTIQKALKKGWFVNRGNYVAGVAGIAVPFPFGGRQCAIALGAPLSRVEKRTDELGQIIGQKVQEYFEQYADADHS